MHKTAIVSVYSFDVELETTGAHPICALFTKHHHAYMHDHVLARMSGIRGNTAESDIYVHTNGSKPHVELRLYL